jgi:hypothetical protein
VSGTLIFLMAVHFMTSPGTVTVEEVVAVVGRTPILASDVELADLVRLVDRAPAATDSDHRSRLLDGRIRLELQFRNLEDSGTLYRLDLDVAAVVAELTRRAGGEEALRPRLAAAGLSWSDLEELALRLAAANAYVEQRLRPRISVGLEEIEAAYQSLLHDADLPQAEERPSLASVRDQLHQLLVERKLADELELWLAQARERIEVTRFVP